MNWVLKALFCLIVGLPCLAQAQRLELKYKTVKAGIVTAMSHIQIGVTELLRIAESDDEFKLDAICGRLNTYPFANAEVVALGRGQDNPINVINYINDEILYFATDEQLNFTKADKVFETLIPLRRLGQLADIQNHMISAKGFCTKIRISIELDFKMKALAVTPGNYQELSDALNYIAQVAKKVGDDVKALPQSDATVDATGSAEAEMLRLIFENSTFPIKFIDIALTNTGFST